ncbi:MAG: FecR family protein [Legionella sp.]
MIIQSSKARFSLCMLYAISLWLILPLSYAAQQAAIVIAAVGKVTANTRDLARRSLLYSGDTIKTGPGSKVSFKFTDDSIVTLSPNSSYIISNYSYQKGSAPNVFKAKLEHGGLKTITGVIGKEAMHTQDAKDAGIPEDKQVKVARYEVKAAVATIGVRGTEYKCMINAESDKLLVSAMSGTVAAHFDDQYVELGEGADAAYMEISSDGSYQELVDDPISDSDFDVSEDDADGDDDDESSDDDSSDDDSDDAGDDAGDED